MENYYYTSGEFAKKANVTIRTIRYYDKQGILTPSYRNDSGYRMYTDEDFGKLQKILTLKYLGFSLEEIKTMTIHDTKENLEMSLELQIHLIKKRREHLELVEKSLVRTKELLEIKKEVDWEKILNLIHLTNMERDLVEQYKTAANLDIRIKLHNMYSVNKKGWFLWLYSQLDFERAKNILEIGCGNGALWEQGDFKALSYKNICLSDISEGMIEAAKELLEEKRQDFFQYKICDMEKLPFKEKTKDMIIANHVLFYAKNLTNVLKNISSILKEDGTFYCSTYGKGHMKEITDLVKEFDKRITLSEVILQEQFGLENGRDLLTPYFSKIELRLYEDALIVTDASPLMDYILSCHGNQKEILSGRYEVFLLFLKEKIKSLGAVHIKKEAGIFVCTKK